MLKSLQDCLSSLTGRPDDSVEGWYREDLPPHRYKWMHSPSDPMDAMELYRKRAPKWKGHLLRSLHEDGTLQGRTYDDLMSVMKDACDFPRGSLRRVAEGAPQYKPRYTLLKRSMEITAELDPSMRLSCALLLDQATGYRIGDVTEYRSELFDPETYYGHYFINGKDSNGKPTIRAIGHRWEFLDWKEGGEGALDMDGEGKSSNGKYGWQNAGKMTSWLGGRVNWGERASRSPRRDADGDSFTKWQESGECTGCHTCEGGHRMYTAEEALRIALEGEHPSQGVTHQQSISGSAQSHKATDETNVPEESSSLRASPTQTEGLDAELNEDSFDGTVTVGGNSQLISTPDVHSSALVD